MKAFRYYGSHDAKIEEIPIPEIGAYEILVAVKACGICGTDVKTYLRGHPKIRPGTVLGHEVAGVIAVSKHPRFKTGDRVVVAPYTPCLECEACKRGHYSLCENLFDTLMDPGGFAEYVRVPKRIVDQGVFNISETLDFTIATLTEPLACCVHGLEALNIQAGQSLLIIGDGPMGLLQAVLGKKLGASPIILSGMIPERLEVASRVADVVIDASKQDLAEEISQLSPGGADKVIVSVGEVSVAQNALPLVRKGGTINLFAGMPNGAQITLDVNRIHYDEIKVLGTFGFSPKNFKRALDWLASGGLSVSGLITSTIELDDVLKGIKAAARYEGVKTIVLTSDAKESAG